VQQEGVDPDPAVATNDAPDGWVECGWPYATAQAEAAIVGCKSPSCWPYKTSDEARAGVTAAARQALNDQSL